MPYYGLTSLERTAKRLEAEAHQRALECGREHREHWEILQYRCNHSRFNGGHYTPSDYSQLRCSLCGRVWRTKAAYVEQMVANS